MDNKNCITRDPFFVFIAKYYDGQVHADEVFGPYYTDGRLMNTQFQSETPNRRDHFEGLTVVGGILLKGI